MIADADPALLPALLALVEKHSGLAPFPRSRLLNVRSMEIFRQLGIDRQVTERAFAPEHGRVRFRDSFTAPDFERSPDAAEVLRVQEAISKTGLVQ